MLVDFAPKACVSALQRTAIRLATRSSRWSTAAVNEANSLPKLAVDNSLETVCVSVREVLVLFPAIAIATSPHVCGLVLWCGSQH
eukprot:SAG31_NODE_13871_length_841_cov_0.942049_2_plen_84_part_01